MKIQKITNVLFGASFILLMACSKESKPLDQATFGTISIACDKAFETIAQAELQVFHAQYPNAKLNLVSTSEDSAFNLLVKDSVKLIISSRDLNNYEKALFAKNKIIPKINCLANDAVVFITSSKDTNLTINEIEDLFLNGKIKNEKFNLTFDQSNSSNFNYVRKKYFKDNKIPAHCFASKSVVELVEYISNNSSSIACIGLMQLQQVKLPVNCKLISIDNKIACQESIYDKSYPFIRSINIINCESRFGLGTGFSVFVTSEQGQRIVLKEGLQPFNPPSREVYIYNKRPVLTK